MTDGIKKDIMLATSQGMGIRFSEEEVRPMGLVAAGVSGMKLEEKDGVIGMEILPSEGNIFLLASDGKAKRLEHSDMPQQGRYGKGVRLWSLPPKKKSRIMLAPFTLARGQRNQRVWTPQESESAPARRAIQSSRSSRARKRRS